ncbi:MAG: toll/interleukin-1 receptor domain-containing protein [Armatimonadetes bacterium]|nr:toll/interleukin-1 receptor domain-containing protein [Armatimonadota bacterium]
MSNDPHRAFISHASEDKPVYAEPLAVSLRAMGVDAWLDKWEMQPGDSLIQKIFSEGIHGTDAAVIILSHTSIVKPWVQKELNVAAVDNIQKALRLIPVRVDDCTVPDVLRDLLWLDWTAEGGAEPVAKRIVETLHGHSSKPPLGTPPPHLTAPRFTVPGLNARDIKVLQIIFEASLESGTVLIQGEPILGPAEEAGLSFDQVKESIQMLESRGFIVDEDQTIAQRQVIVTLNPGEALKLGQSYGYDLEAMLRKLVAIVCNEQAHSLYALVEQLPEYPRGLVEASVRVLAGNGFWRESGTIDGNLHIYSVTPTAKRWLEANT